LDRLRDNSGQEINIYNALRHPATEAGSADHGSGDEEAVANQKARRWITRCANSPAVVLAAPAAPIREELNDVIPF
jgi:hypothetical protein